MLEDLTSTSRLYVGITLFGLSAHSWGKKKGCWNTSDYITYLQPEMMESVGVRRNEIAKWVGISSAIMASCQCIMAVPWGTFSDRYGRKYAILLGLTFTMIFSLVFGFSQSLTTLLVSRAFLGLMNGNVGIIRTMVAELVREKELQPLAFSMMPLVWAMGSIFGPAFGGALANPAVKHPNIFGGWGILRKYPFALPNILSAIFFVIGITTGFLFLEVRVSLSLFPRVLFCDGSLGG